MRPGRTPPPPAEREGRASMIFVPLTGGAVIHIYPCRSAHDRLLAIMRGHSVESMQVSPHPQGAGKRSIQNPLIMVLGPELILPGVHMLRFPGHLLKVSVSDLHEQSFTNSLLLTCWTGSPIGRSLGSQLNSRSTPPHRLSRITGIERRGSGGPGVTRAGHRPPASTGAESVTGRTWGATPHRMDGLDLEKAPTPFERGPAASPPGGGERAVVGGTPGRNWSGTQVMSTAERMNPCTPCPASRSIRSPRVVERYPTVEGPPDRSTGRGRQAR